ncbi:hypothetical protein VNO78_32594 [Psophocarpus tetragonolobus]|uniref:Uncharacterized protein n=1 Tax=Psophocarpus tetragonolobus TaxID=3891 RepID=A0AAN9NVJ4_PSOTE
MEITFIPLILLYIFRLKSLLERADDSPHQVVDTSGDKLMVGINYYIIPVPTKCSSSGKCKGNNGFGLAKIVANNKTCPLDILVVEEHQGQPLTFTPIHGQKKGAPVCVSTDLNIEFFTQTGCPQYSSVWKIDQFDRSTRKWFVTSGGVVGHPSWRTISSWFKIEKYEMDYKLVSCPTFCGYCRVQCRDIGVYEDQNGNKRLALTDTPYKVRFQKA